MSTILVEARSCPLCQEILQKIADTCEALEHRVVRWRGPISGPGVPHSRRIVGCDAAFVWNGAHHTLEGPLASLRQMGAQVAFVELGWNPQRGTCQIDRRGINAEASWVREALTTPGFTSLPLREKGDLLVALQLDEDTQVTKLSPWFANMRQFVAFLCQHSALPVRVRAHPKAPVNNALRQMTIEHGGNWDDSPNFSSAVERCRAVAILNSSVGIEALGQQLPVLCYGLSNYRHPGAVYCLDASPDATTQVTADLARGACDLTVERSRAAYDRVMSHQWRCEEIPSRLPPLLEAMLADAPANRAGSIPAPRSWFRLPTWLSTSRSA